MTRLDVGVVHQLNHQQPSLRFQLGRAAPAPLWGSVDPVERRLSADIGQALRNLMKLCRHCRPNSAKCQRTWKAWRRKGTSISQKYVVTHPYRTHYLTFVQLRDIEILVQQQSETLESQGKEDDNLKEIQKILYSTEVGTIFIYHNHLSLAYPKLTGLSRMVSKFLRTLLSTKRKLSDCAYRWSLGRSLRVISYDITFTLKTKCSLALTSHFARFVVPSSVFPYNRSLPNCSPALSSNIRISTHLWNLSFWTFDKEQIPAAVS